jgi:hypothetical protein
VTRNRPSPRGERGQLILIGAFVVSTVVVGLTLLLNTTLFVDSAVPSTPSDQLEESSQFDRQSRRTMTELLHRTNVDERNRTKPELETDVTGQAGEYSRLLGSVYTTSGSATVNITLDTDNSTFGERVVQQEDGGLVAPGGDDDWEALDGASTARATIGWFVADVNVSGTETDPATITVSNTSDAITYTVERDDGRLRVRSNPTFAGPVTANCTPSFNRVLVNFYQGDLRGNCGGSSSFTGIDRLGGQHATEIDDGDRVTGEYEFIINETGATYDSLTFNGPYDECDTGEPADEPCRTPAIWEANVSTAYLGSTVTYTNTYNVSVYTEADG